MKPKLIIAVTGASGAIYAKVLIEKLMQLNKQFDYKSTSVVFSDNAKKIWHDELGEFNERKFPFTVYEANNFNAPFASGSARYDIMLVCPCSMGMLARIASGVSNDLISRTADVMLKEKKKLILVPREIPLNLIHINNMKIITEAGGIICPASPSFYSKPENISQLVETVVDKILYLAGFNFESYSWKGNII